ncbi:lasso peptide biosynthesis B2 protein [Brevundimonas sp.]|uniref:lasso peptide biosynthesis B2 protein n=1 Tax=Brevundimonas sp. TaxID=1871086 RepID=UPI0039E4A4E3
MSSGPFRQEKLSAPSRQVLLQAGFLVEGPAAVEAPPHPDLPQPRLDLRDHSGVKPGAGDLVALALALTDLARLGRDPAVERLLTLTRETPGASGDPAPIVRAAAAFSHLLPWLPFEGACLRRSALLAAFLRRRGLRARWVFGVRTWPFAAHCWLQAGDICLNDDVERLAAYTPILAV